MTSLDTTTTMLTMQQPPGQTFDEEQMAEASFLIDRRLSTACGFYKTHGRHVV